MEPKLNRINWKVILDTIRETIPDFPKYLVELKIDAQVGGIPCIKGRCYYMNEWEIRDFKVKTDGSVEYYN